MCCLRAREDLFVFIEALACVHDPIKQHVFGLWPMDNGIYLDCNFTFLKQDINVREVSLCS